MAVVGLGVYAAFLYATILIFDVTLTLPGFAGMILTLGVAADANIVIFERIKEEARAGKSVRAAVANGYAKGFKTIIDANVVTAITAVILFVLATSGVRGFAFLLLLGTALSIVTAVFATRAFLGLLGNARWFDNPKFMGAEAREIPAWQRIDFVGKRRIWFITAGILITLSIGALVFNGLNLGIDFEGGTEITFTTPQPTSLADVREEAANVGQGAAQIQGTGEVVGEDRYSEFRIRTESLDQAEQTALTSDLRNTFDTENVNVRNVSASFSDQILRSAIYAIIFSFLLITIYIWMRFEWRFAVPILRTIINDGVIALGIYSLSGREVTAATVAAFLTIIGYSIYDTIIVFDRVRENMVADAALDVRADRERVAVGDHPALAGDDLHHAASGRRAVPLRRRDAAGLRLRRPRRHRHQRLLDLLHRRPVPRRPEGEGAGVQAADGERQARVRGLGRPHPARGRGAGRRAAGAGSAPGHHRHRRPGRRGRGRDRDRDRDPAGRPRVGIVRLA